VAEVVKAGYDHQILETRSNLLSVRRPEFPPALLPLLSGQEDLVNHELILLGLCSDRTVDALHWSSQTLERHFVPLRIVASPDERSVVWRTMQRIEPYRQSRGQEGSTRG